MPDFTPSAPLTNEEFLDALSLCDGATDVGMKTIVEVLRAEVPGKTAVLNAAKGWTGNRAITVPKDYGMAPGVLADRHVNSVLVGASTSTGDHGPGALANTSQVVVYSVGKRIEIDSQIQDAHRRASVIKGILHCYLNGFINADGLYIWKQLKLTGFSFLPEPYADYAGVACYYEMFQPPGENYWADL